MIATSTIPSNRSEKRRHLAVEIGFALGERAVEIEDDQTFHVSSATAVPDRGAAQPEKERCNRTW